MAEGVGGKLVEFVVAQDYFEGLGNLRSMLSAYGECGWYVQLV